MAVTCYVQGRRCRKQGVQTARLQDFPLPKPTTIIPSPHHTHTQSCPKHLPWGQPESTAGREKKGASNTSTKATASLHSLCMRAILVCQSSTAPDIELSCAQTTSGAKLLRRFTLSYVLSCIKAVALAVYRRPVPRENSFPAAFDMSPSSASSGSFLQHAGTNLKAPVRACDRRSKHTVDPSSHVLPTAVIRLGATELFLFLCDSFFSFNTIYPVAVSKARTKHTERCLLKIQTHQVFPAGVSRIA